MSHKISAKIVGHSKTPKGEELITYELVFPRYILAEFNTHREFSRNSASSRAIPYEKMVEAVNNNTFIPVAWQLPHSGMQGKEYIEEPQTIGYLEKQHMFQLNMIIDSTYRMHTNGVTKQILNRYLEPYAYHKVIMTTSLPGLKNFFSLRCPNYNHGDKTFYSRKDVIKDISLDKNYTQKDTEYAQGLSDLEWLKRNSADGEIHISILAELMWDAYNESTPDELLEKEYHIPYSKDIKFIGMTTGLSLEDKIKVSIGMCARVSYTPVGDESTLSAKTYIGIYDKMVQATPFHASPFEHVARVMTDDEYSRFIRGNMSIYELLAEDYREEIKGWCRNFKCYIQERYRIEECRG